MEYGGVDQVLDPYPESCSKLGANRKRKLNIPNKYMQLSTLPFPPVIWHREMGTNAPGYRPPAPEVFVPAFAVWPAVQYLSE